MDKLKDKEIQHIYWRFGFGITPLELNDVRHFSKQEIINQLFTKSEQYTPLFLNLSILEKNRKDLSREEKKEIRKVRNQKTLELNILWFKRLYETEQIVREKMVLFFHDHFAVRLKSPRACLHLNNVIRKHAIGNFGDMLLEVSKSPAMLMFLNNRQNRKNSPNENFAREVMELFTLGRDNGYTEKDIKEAARAFTGWNFDKNGKFVFRQRHHDFGIKTIFGKTDNFSGEDVINLLLEQKQTAKYITKKVYKYFVNDTLNQQHIEELTTIFYNSNYNLKILMETILFSDWFYEEKNIGTKIKSPIELIVGLSKPFKIQYKDPKVLIYLQRKLNQVLFFPPNVAGWPGGKAWIDNSTLMLRMKLASVTLNSGVIEWHDKGDMPEGILMMQKRNERIKNRTEKKVQAIPNWDVFLDSIGNIEKQAIIGLMLQPRLSRAAKHILSNFDQKSTNTKNFIIEILSLPEYQLC